jgi:hypothetical protein
MREDIGEKMGEEMCEKIGKNMGKKMEEKRCEGKRETVIYRERSPRQNAEDGVKQPVGSTSGATCIHAVVVRRFVDS